VRCFGGKFGKVGGKSSKALASSLQHMDIWMFVTALFVLYDAAPVADRSVASNKLRATTQGFDFL